MKKGSFPSAATNPFREDSSSTGLPGKQQILDVVKHRDNYRLTRELLNSINT